MFHIINSFHLSLQCMVGPYADDFEEQYWFMRRLLNSNEYLHTVETIKQEIRAAQYKATVRVNQELLMLYYPIDEIINEH